MKITWLTQGSFLFESSGKRILIDPYMSDFLEEKGMTRLVDFPLKLEELKPDVLICSHDHIDHLDPEAVLNIAQAYPNCLIAGPKSCYNHFLKLGINQEQCRMLNYWDKLELGEIMITAVAAHHTEPQAIGVVIEENEKKFYVSCDTVFDNDLINDITSDSNVVLICINGRLGNMLRDEALKIIETINPETALPMHYGLFAENTADPKPFVDRCLESGIKSFEMEIGKTFEL